MFLYTIQNSYDNILNTERNLSKFEKLAKKPDYDIWACNDGLLVK